MSPFIMKKTLVGVVLLAAWSGGPALSAQAAHPWEVVELTFQARGAHANAYTVVTEPWYEFVEGNPSGMEIRYAAWSAILSGAAGHSYGGGHVWWAHLPESPANQGPWPIEPSFATNTLDYAGARSMGFLAKFLGAIPWWELEPHPELVSEYPAPFCGAVPGSRYVLYLRYGGRLKVDLRPSSATDAFEYTWVDLEQGTERKPGRVSGGAVREFHAPEDYPASLRFKDWLLHIRRVERDR